MNGPPERPARIAATFRSRFGTEPLIWCRAPGRVDLMGSHTDYNLGRVLTLPIDRDTWIAARPRPDRIVQAHSLNLDADTRFDLDTLERAPGRAWCNYLRGVASVLRAEGQPLCGFDAVIHSTVPLGGGLSSSAALECATATVFETLGGWSLDPVRKAQLCQQAEHQFVGVHCGILDQYTACAGQAGCALLLDCRELSARPVQLADGVQIVIGDTRSKRELMGSAYGQRRAHCEAGARQLGVKALREVSLERFQRHESELPAEMAKRCRFILEEDERVLRLADALTAGDAKAIGRLCAASFDGACRLFEITTPAMHAMRDAMLQAPGVLGARQAGAGFGGCLVAFVDPGLVEAFAAAVRRGYHDRTGTVPELYPVHAAAGAGRVGEEVGSY
jgi:galactokinase